MVTVETVIRIFEFTKLQMNFLPSASQAKKFSNFLKMNKTYSLRPDKINFESIISYIQISVFQIFPLKFCLTKYKSLTLIALYSLLPRTVFTIRCVFQKIFMYFKTYSEKIGCFMTGKSSSWFAAFICTCSCWSLL